MKKKKILTLFLAGSLCAALTGCGSSLPVNSDLSGSGDVIESVDGLTKLDEKAAADAIQSLNRKYHDIKIDKAEISMNLQAKLSLASLSAMTIDLNLTDNAQIDEDSDFIHQNMAGNISLLGTSSHMEMEAYTEKDGSKYVTYQKQTIDGTESGWTKEYDDDMDKYKLSEIVPSGVDNTIFKDVYQDKNSEKYVFVADGSSLEDAVESMTDEMADQIKLDCSDMDLFITTDPGLAMIGYYVDLGSGLTFKDDSAKVESMTLSMKVDSINKDFSCEIPKDVKDSAQEADKDEPSDLSDLSGLLFGNTANQTTVPDTKESNETEPMIPAGVENYSDITVGGKAISLPMSLDDIKAMGFSVDDSNLPETIDPHWIDFAYIVIDEDNEVMLVLSNDTDNALPSKDCPVTGISLSVYDGNYEPAKLSFYGVKPGMTTGAVEAILGKYESSYDGGNGYVSNDYTYNGYTVNITYNNGIATEIGVSAERPNQLSL